MYRLVVGHQGREMKCQKPRARTNSRGNIVLINNKLSNGDNIFKSKRDLQIKQLIVKMLFGEAHGLL